MSLNDVEAKSIRDDHIHSIGRRELLHVIEHTLLSPMLYAHKNGTKVNKLMNNIKQAVSEDSQKNCKRNDVCSMNGIAAISAKLLEFIDQLHVDKPGWSIWVPMILLLSGSFSHMPAPTYCRGWWSKCWIYIFLNWLIMCFYHVVYLLSCIIFPYNIFDVCVLSFSMFRYIQWRVAPWCRYIKRSFIFNWIFIEQILWVACFYNNNTATEYIYLVYSGS